MKPLDPRLLRYARSSRVFLAIGAVLGLVQTASMVAFAWCVSWCVTQAIGGTPLADLTPALLGLVGAVLVRGLAQWATEWTGARAAAVSKSELRAELMRAAARTNSHVKTTDLTMLATHGLDALDSYFAKYLPQLLLTAIAMPVLIVITFIADPTSAITEILVLPVIPLFMILIGWATQRAQRAQLDSLTRLAASFLEIIEGLSTLKIFGRARRQRERVRTVTEDYRRSTMKVLRLSFLSGFALELFASISVALVAVQIGIRLIDDEMTLLAGLFALILAPEVFAPLRAVGAQFHAASEGVEASARVFEIIERSGAAGTQTKQDAAPSVTTPRYGDLQLRDVRVTYGDHIVLDDLSATFRSGAVTAIVGESGVGKTTLLRFIRGAQDGATGERLLDGDELLDLQAADSVAWMGQSAGLIEASVAANVALGDADAPLAQVRDALTLAGIAELDPALELGVGGAGISGGQAQRVSLARTIYRARSRNCPIVLLDEPTSALDADREQLVIGAMHALAREGRVVAVVSHRRAVVAAADAVLELPAHVTEPVGAASEGAHID